MTDEKRWYVVLNIELSVDANILSDKVVEEKSACIDDHRKIALPTDHFKINKYDEPEDYSFRTVYSIIKKMARHAIKKVRERLKRRCNQATDLFILR